MTHGLLLTVEVFGDDIIIRDVSPFFPFYLLSDRS